MSERLRKLFKVPSYSSIYLPLLLFAVALAMRLCRLGAKSLWDDEAAALSMSAMPLSKLFSFMFSHDPHGPIYVLLPKLLGLGWTSGEFALRLPHALLGALAVPLAFALLREFYSRPSALIGAAVMAVSPLFIQISQELRLYTILLCLFLASTLLLARWLKGRVRQAIFAPAYFLLILAGLYTDAVPFAGFLFFQWFCGWRVGISRGRLGSLIALQGCAGLLFLPFVYFYMHGATHGGFDIHLGGQSGRILSSPLSQLMMVWDTLAKVLHSLLFPTLDYWKSLTLMLRIEKESLRWLFLLSGCALLAGTLGGRGGSRGRYGRRLLPGKLLAAVAGLGLVFLTSCRLAGPGGWWFGLVFLLPLALLLTVILVPIITPLDGDCRRRAILSLLIAIPILYGAKLLVPLDPRHLAIPFVFLLGHLGDAVQVLWRKTAGRVVCLALAAGLFLSLVTYYRSDTQLFHQQNYRAACQALQQQSKDKGKMYVNVGWGGTLGRPLLPAPWRGRVPLALLDRAGADGRGGLAPGGPD